MRSAMILGIIDDIIGGIQSLIGNFLYGLLGGIFFTLIDWVQSIFRALAGLEPMVIGGETVNKGDEAYDIVYWLLQTDIVQDIFWSMVTFSLILMFLMTGLAIIRNAYQDKPKPIGDIIGGVFKGLLGMILLPIACMVGLMFGNIILLAVDKGTGASGSTTLSGTLFLSAAYDANIARDPTGDTGKGVFSGMTNRMENYRDLLNATKFEDYLQKNGGSKYIATDADTMGSWSEDDWDNIADYIDNAYVTGQIKTNAGLTLNTYYTWAVLRCYNTWYINYIVLVVGGCIMLGFIFKMCFGMIGRIFKLTIDFVLIPVVMAMMPFDTKPSQSWKGDFVKNTTLAYSTVGVLNLYFSILPIVNKIEFSNSTFGGGGSGFLDGILKLILSIVGLFSAESIISSVGGWFGTGDLIKEGAAVNKTFKDGMKSVTDKAGKVTGTVGKFVGAGKARAKDTEGGFWKKTGAFLGGGVAGTAGAALNKRAEGGVIGSFYKGMSEGGKTYKEQKEAGGIMTNLMTDEKREEKGKIAQARKSAETIFKDNADKTDFEVAQIVSESEVGKQINAGKTASQDLKKINAQVSRAEDMSTFSKAESGYEKLATSLKGIGISDADLETFLSTGVISKDISDLMKDHPEIESMLDKAAEKDKAAKDAIYKALRGYMTSSNMDTISFEGGANPITIGDFTSKVANGDLKAGDMLKALKAGNVKGKTGSGWQDIKIADIQTQGTTDSSAGKKLLAKHQEFVRRAALWVSGDEKKAVNGLSDADKKIVEKYVSEMGKKEK